MVQLCAKAAICETQQKAIILIFYTDWPLCRAYEQASIESAVVRQAKGLVMIRAYVDQSEQLASHYNDDGYVPHIYMPGQNG